MLLFYYCRTVEDSRGGLNCWTIANEGRRQPVRLLLQDLPCLARMEEAHQGERRNKTTWTTWRTWAAGVSGKHNQMRGKERV